MSNNVSYKLQFEPTINPDKLNVLLRALKQSLGEMGRNIKLVDAEQLKRELQQVDQAVEQVNETAQTAGQVLSKAFKQKDILGAAFAINQVTQLMTGLSQGISETTQPFVQFESSLAELSAITGVSGNDLEAFGEKARELAKTFGGDAVGQLDAFKGVLSRLGPDLAKSPQAMEQMTIAINTLAKAGGLDAAQAMDALTTTMLQFGINLDDPVKAAQEATRIINILAAGAKEGAAEIPQVSEALTVTGVAAKSFNMSIEETNASIQALATGGKYGAEAGTALRNVLGKMAGEEVIPKEALAKLKSLGVDMKVVSDKTIPFSDRLRELSKAANDATAFAQVFGIENAAAATILANSADKVADFTLKLTGTNVAFDQAAINMDTIAGKTDRFKAAINDFLIGVGQTLGTAVTTASQAATQIMPLALTLGQMRAVLPTDAFKNLAANIVGKLVPAAVTGDVATKALNVSFKTLAKTMLTHPLFLGLAGTVAVVAAIKAVSDALHTTAQERADAIQADIKEIEIKKNLNQQDQKRVQSNINLLDQYTQLASKKSRNADEDKKLHDITIQLNKEMPGTVKHTADLGKNLASVATETTKAKEQLKLLQDGMNDLDKRARSMQLTFLAAKVDIKKEKFEDALTAAGQKIDFKGSAFTGLLKLGGKVTDIIFGASMQRDAAEKFSEAIAKDLYTAKTEKALQEISVKVSEALFKGTKDKELATNLFEIFSEEIEARKNYLVAAGDIKIPEVETPGTGSGDGKGGDGKGNKDKELTEKEKKEAEKRAKAVNEIRSKYAEDYRNAWLDLLETQMAEGEQKEKFQAERSYRDKILSLKKQYDEDLQTKDLTDEDKLKMEETYNQKVTSLTKQHEKDMANISQKGIDKMQSDYEGAEEDRTKKLEEEQKKREEIERKQLEFFNELQPSMDKVFAKLAKSLLKFQSDADGNITGVGLTFDDLGKTIEANADLIASTLGMAIGQTVADSKAGLKDFAMVALDTLNSLVPVFVAEILGQELASKSFFGFLSSAALTAALYSAVAVARNAINSLATGGRIDEPTLAVIGDASRARPGSNTEWVLRDDQIKAIVDDSIFKAIAVITGTSKDDLQVEVLKSFSQDVNRLVNAVANLKPLFAESEFNARNVTEFLKSYSDLNNLKSNYYSNKISPEHFNQLRQPLEIRLRSFAEGGTINKPELIIAGDSPRGPEHILDSPALKEVIMASNQLVSPEFIQELREVKEAIYNINIKVGDETIYNSYNKTDTRRRSRYRT